jgi:uncharacterized protein YbjT (DUF2867 family)
MARALIVGCGCRGRELGAGLLDRGWTVRGTSRGRPGAAEIEAAGLEPAIADPARPATLLELIGDVVLVHWLLGSATGGEELLADLHGPRLERFLERLVETPVRGFVYEAAGSVRAPLLAEGAEIVRAAGSAWHIPVAAVEAEPADRAAWLEEMLGATRGLLSQPAA